MKYKELKAGITSHLNSAAEDFFIVGYFLRQISEQQLFIEDGYKSIWDFAKGEYGLSTSSASRFMAINARFSIDGGEHMAEKYIGMGVSKLQEMLGLPDEELEKITKETTVREIRAMKAQTTSPLSFYGFPATKRPEGSLLTTVGCGDGKYDCFSCCRDCGIRQQERYCRTAPLGNPFPCSRMGDDFKRQIQHSQHRDQCQILHPELAPIRAGDKEPNPCCFTCDIKYCFSRCDVAKNEDEQEKKNREAEERRKRREAEAAKPEPNEKDIAAFYKWIGLKTSDKIDVENLKKEYRNAAGGGGADLKDYQGSARGVRINYKKELTWVQLAKRLKEYQHEEQRREARDISLGLKEADSNEIPEKASPVQEEKTLEIIDAEFTEVTVENDEDELLCDDCGPSGSNYKPLQEAEAKAEIIQELHDPETYNKYDVRRLLADHEKDLQAFREAGTPDSLMRKLQKLRIITDALQLLYKTLEEKEAAEID